MYNDTITLFNRHKSNQELIWYPSILHNVNLNMDKAAIIAKFGKESADKAALNIRYQVVDEVKKVGKKIWLPPKEWAAQPSDFLAQSLTFTDGTNFDFFMLGEWEGGEDPVQDKDYPDGFYNALNKRYDYVFSITAVGGPYSVIPHFEIMGK